MRNITFILFFGAFILGVEELGYAANASDLRCADTAAEAHLIKGFALQKDNNTAEALKEYTACLDVQSDCVSCLYEIGWSYWKLGEWKHVIESWEAVQKLDPTHEKVRQFLPTARENKEIVDKKNKVEVYRSKTEMLIQSEPKDGPVVITFMGRWQAYNPQPQNPLDHYDSDIDSPKSATFALDGKTVYVNSLEGGKTVSFDAIGLEKKGVVRHSFTSAQKQLFKKRAPFDYQFPKSIKNPNEFHGKPVESVLTHGGRFLWVTYYRRHFDENGSYPSAMALIDTRSLQIVRVFGTGPIAKYVQVSPDGKKLAVSHWGDNTVGLYDISGDAPAAFHETALLTVQERFDLKHAKGNRDRNCGFCVRGLSFTSDSRFLIVSRMRQGGLAVFDIEHPKKSKYLGTVFGINPGPRDLQMDPKGEFLYSGCNASGFISKIPVRDFIDVIKNKKNASVTVDPKKLGVVSTFAGLGVRSIKVSQDGQYIFAAVNQGSELMALQTQDMKIVARIPVDSYPVGLAISPDASQIWVTSQGRGLKGGNSVGVYQVRYKPSEIISFSTKPALPQESKSEPEPK